MFERSYIVTMDWGRGGRLAKERKFDGMGIGSTPVKDEVGGQVIYGLTRWKCHQDTCG